MDQYSRLCRSLRRRRRDLPGCRCETRGFPWRQAFPWSLRGDGRSHFLFRRRLRTRRAGGFQQIPGGGGSASVVAGAENVAGKVFACGEHFLLAFHGRVTCQKERILAVFHLDYDGIAIAVGVVFGTGTETVSCAPPRGKVLPIWGWMISLPWAFAASTKLRKHGYPCCRLWGPRSGRRERRSKRPRRRLSGPRHSGRQSRSPGSLHLVPGDGTPPWTSNPDPAVVKGVVPIAG